MGCEEEEADSIKAGHCATVNTKVFVIHHIAGLGNTQSYASRPNSKSVLWLSKTINWIWYLFNPLLLIELIWSVSIDQALILADIHVNVKKAGYRKYSN